MFILIIEDTVQDRALLEDALAKIGISKVSTVMDGGHAIEFLGDRISKGEALPDAVLLDLNLPLVSGHEVLRFCKKTPQMKGVKVVVLSRLTSENEIQVCYYMGATRYIPKTSDAANLRLELQSALLPGSSPVDRAV